MQAGGERTGKDAHKTRVLPGEVHQGVYSSTVSPVTSTLPEGSSVAVW